MRRVVALLVLAAIPLAAQDPPRRVRPTLVKVVDENGDAVAGARVLCCSAPLHDVPFAAPIYHNELVEGRTDEKGRCRIRAAAGRSWSAWAVWQDGNKRLASNLLPDIEVGRPLRIVVKPFEVPNVRWTGIEKWRTKVGKLATAYVSDITAVESPGTLATSVSLVSSLESVTRQVPTSASRRALAALPVLRLPAPASRDDVVALPPLPLGKYYPVLTDEHGGFLDMRFMNPVFLKKPSSERVKAMYERNLLLEQLWMGEPISVTGTFYNDKELKLDGVEIWLRPTHGSLVHERRYVTDKDGRFELFVPGRAEATDPTGSYFVKLYAVCPGHEPEYLQLPMLKAGSKHPESEFRLRRGRMLEWRVRGATDADREPNRFFLRTVFSSGAKSVRQHTVPIRLEQDGRLRLPAPRERGNATPLWELFLLRDGRIVPLYRAQGRVPKKLVIDLDRIRVVEVEVACEFTSLRNPTVRLYRSKTDTNWSGLNCPDEVEETSRGQIFHFRRSATLLGAGLRGRSPDAVLVEPPSHVEDPSQHVADVAPGRAVILVRNADHHRFDLAHA